MQECSKAIKKDIKKARQTTCTKVGQDGGAVARNLHYDTKRTKTSNKERYKESYKAR